MVNDVMFSSDKSEWETPDWLFKPYQKQYGIAFDVCATPTTAKTYQFWTEADDALSRVWQGSRSFWMNPPYGREIGKWVRKAHLSARDNGVTVVCLLPARTDTKWWWDHCWNGEIHWIKGRIKFLLGGKEVTSAPFPSAVVIFHSGLMHHQDHRYNIDAGKRTVRLE